MAPGICSLEHQAASQAFLELHLQGIVVGDALAALHPNRSEYIARCVHRVTWVQDGLVVPVSYASRVGRAFCRASGRNGIAFIDQVQMPALSTHIPYLQDHLSRKFA